MSLEMTQNGPDPSFHRLLSYLEQIRKNLDSKEDDFVSVSSLFQSCDIQAVIKKPSPKEEEDTLTAHPDGSLAADLALEICKAVRARDDPSSESEELVEILSSADVKGLLTTHDEVVSKDPAPRDALPEPKPEPEPEPVIFVWSPPDCNTHCAVPTAAGPAEKSLSAADGEAESTTKLVELVKNSKEQLGVTIRCCEESKSIVVARILKGGVADKSGALSVGDEIVEIAGNSVKGKTVSEVVDIMSAMKDTVVMKIVPVTELNKITAENKILLRAQFDNDPADDKFIPCREAGLKFSKGDILQVLAKDDFNWWQAKKEGGTNIGLIPSKPFQDRRHLFEKLTEQRPVNGKRGILHLRMTKGRRRHSTPAGKDLQHEEVLSYEEVRLSPPDKTRPILLVGAAGVGKSELKKKLLCGEPEKFATAVPHTSRPMKSFETEGKEYHFVSRHTMENYIQNNKLVEFGEYKKCLYGTSVESIRKLMKMGKVCVLKVEPQVLKLLRRPDIRPYIVYVKPPVIEKLRSSRLTVRPKSSFERKGVRTFKEEDLKEMIEKSGEIERVYGHLFDATVVNSDLQVAYFELSNAIEKALEEPQWVPASWLR